VKLNQYRYPIPILYLSLLPQAILSQFSHAKKLSDNAKENDEDNTALEELEYKDGKEYTEAELDDDDNIDPSVQSSDAAMVDEVAADADADESLPQLTQQQINLGQFSLSKVWIVVQPLTCLLIRLLDTQPRQTHLQQPGYSH